MEAELVRMRANEAAAAAAPNVMVQQQILQTQTDLLTQLTQANAARAEKPRPMLVDTKGLGKPNSFSGNEKKFLPWKIRLENFIVNVFPDLAPALTWAEEYEEAIIDVDVTNAFGDAEDVDFIPDIFDKQQQLYSALQSLVEGEAFDIVNNCSKGKGLEAWRKINRRYDPSTAGRKRALLKHILNPERTKISDLSAALEKWIDSIRMYERRKDSEGARLVIQEDIKISVLESLVPPELEKHMQFNRDRFSSFDKSLKEISDFVEIRHGHRINVTNTGSTGGGGGRSRKDDDMDVGAFHRGGGKDKGGKRGGGKGDKANSKPKGACFNCGKEGHQANSCWAPGGGAAAPVKKDQWKPGYKPKGSKPKGDKKGSGKGKTKSKGSKNKSKKRKGAGSLEQAEEEWPEEEWPAEEWPEEPEQEQAYFGLAGDTDCGGLDICGLTAAEEIEEQNEISERYKKLEKSLDMCGPDEWLLTNALMRAIEAEWDDKRKLENVKAISLEEAQKVPERPVSGSSSNSMFRLLEKGQLAAMSSSMQILKKKLGLCKGMKPDSRASNDAHRLKDIAQLAKEREAFEELKRTHDDHNDERREEFGETPISAEGVVQSQTAQQKKTLDIMAAVKYEDLKDQNWHDSRYHRMIQSGVTHSVAWYHEKKRRRSVMCRKKWQPIRSKKHETMTQRWHGKHDECALKDSDYVPSTEGVGYKMAGEILSSADGMGDGMSGGKFRLQSGELIRKQSRKTDEHDVVVDDDTQYRNLTNAEKKDFREYDKDDKDLYLKAEKARLRGKSYEIMPFSRKSTKKARGSVAAMLPDTSDEDRRPGDSPGIDVLQSGPGTESESEERYDQRRPGDSPGTDRVIATQTLTAAPKWKGKGKPSAILSDRKGKKGALANVQKGMGKGKGRYGGHKGQEGVRYPDRPCARFQEKGSCSKGDQCWFAHDAATTAGYSKQENERSVTSPPQSDAELDAEELEYPSEEEHWEYKDADGNPRQRPGDSPGTVEMGDDSQAYTEEEILMIQNAAWHVMGKKGKHAIDKVYHGEGMSKLDKVWHEEAKKKRLTSVAAMLGDEDGGFVAHSNKVKDWETKGNYDVATEADIERLLYKVNEVVPEKEAKRRYAKLHAALEDAPWKKQRGQEHSNSPQRYAKEERSISPMPTIPEEQWSQGYKTYKDGKWVQAYATYTKGDAKGKGKGKGKQKGGKQKGQKAKAQDQGRDHGSASSSAGPRHGSLGSFGDKDEKSPLVKVRLTLDTGAAVVALPKTFATQYKLDESKGGSYRTASAEIVQDEGGRNVKGQDSNGNKLALAGRVADVHKPLVAGSQVAKRSDMYLWDDGGFILPKTGVIAKKLHAYMEKLMAEHGTAELTPVYVHNGVYCMDYWLHAPQGADLADFESDEKAKKAAEAAKSSKTGQP